MRGGVHGERLVYMQDGEPGKLCAGAAPRGALCFGSKVSTDQKRHHVDQIRRVMRTISSALSNAAIAILLTGARVAAEDQVPMPLGAFLCKSIEPVIEHARIVRQPTSAGLREFVESRVESGACRVIKTEVTVRVVDVDQRGYALVQEKGQSGDWWTDAENVWGYFDAPAKLKAWKKP